MIQRLKLWYLWLKLSYRFQFSHHPLCEQYSNQRIEIAGVHLCQGCTLLTTGSLTGGVTGLIFSFSFFFLPWYLPLIFAFLFMVPAYFIDRQFSGRMAKRFARFSMGLGLGYGIFLVIFTQNWILRGVYLLVILVLYKAYKYYRVKHPAKDLCPSCDYFDQKPKCPGFIHQLEANKVYMEKATDLMAPHFQKRMDEIRMANE